MNNLQNQRFMVINNDTGIEQDQFLNAEGLDDTSNRSLVAALRYASIGYPVFPLHNPKLRNGVVHCSCKKWLTCTNIGKHPRTVHGFLDATTHEATIRLWWAKFPSANIGIRTGKVSGIFVLDVDSRHGGELSLEALTDYFRHRLKEEFSEFPPTLTAISGSGGKHYYFKHPLLFSIPSSSGVIDSGLDIRGDGGYIVAPPSQHSSGGEYRWFGVSTPILDAPDWLIHEIVNPESASEIATTEAKRFSLPENGKKVEEGQRTTTLVRYVSGLLNSYDEDEVERRALALNDEWFEPPLEEREVAYTVSYLFRRYGLSSVAKCDSQLLG